MPLLDPTAEAIVIALVSIVYGIRWERYYTAWISVVMNIVFTAVLLASVDFPTGFIWIIAIYIGLGIVALVKTLRHIFFLFGTKTFGALSLTVALAQSGNINWTDQIISALKLSSPDWLAHSGLQYLVGWITVSGIVHVLGFMFLRKRYGQDL